MSSVCSLISDNHVGAPKPIRNSGSQRQIRSLLNWLDQQTFPLHQSI